MPSRTDFSSTIATGTNADSGVVGLPDVGWLTVYVKSDKALTGKLMVTPDSPNNADWNASTADWYQLGSSLSIVASTNFVQILQVDGVGAAKLNLANASGTTATVAVILRPGPRRTVH